MSIDRRNFCKMSLPLALAMGNLPFPIVSALAQQGRVPKLNLLGFVLAIHVPAVAAIQDILPNTFGYGQPDISRMNQIRVVTQSMLGGSGDVGNVDPPTTIAADEAGGKLKMVGKFYNQTSLVLLVNADRVKSYEDLAKPSTRVAIGAKGEITHIMLVGPLLKRGIEFDKMTVLEMPGSGARVSALLSNRIDAGNVHFDQVDAIAKQGNFKVLIEPWKEFRNWVNEIWVVREDWLGKPENERLLVDLLKATSMAFRKANTDFDWYLEQYKKYSSIPSAQQTTAESLRPTWERLRTELKAWPEDVAVTVSEFDELLPAYRAAGAIRGTVKIEDIVEPKYAQQALRELAGK